MQIIDEPSIYLIGRQIIDEAQLEKFLAANDVQTWETDTEVAGQRLVEISGRLCYMSYAKPRPGGHDAYIRNILESGHGSVLEHAVFNFVIEGVSRSFTHELVRHRAGFGFSQLSQRFFDESQAAFVVPPDYAEEVAHAEAFLDHCEPAWRDSIVATIDRHLPENAAIDPNHPATVGMVWLRSMARSLESYRFLADYGAWKNRDEPDPTLRKKRAREAARSVLPNATETKIFVTANARALRHFVELRGSVHADREIRRVALGVLDLLARSAPSLFGDYADIPGVGLTTIYKKV